MKERERDRRRYTGSYEKIGNVSEDKLTGTVRKIVGETGDTLGTR